MVAFEDVEKIYTPDKFKMYVAIGYTKLNTVRAEKYHEAKKKGYNLVSYISSKITKWKNLQIGDNCFIFENQVFQPWTKIGNNVIIWSGNHFGHNVIVGNHVFIASHVVLSGGVQVGDFCFLGINSTIKDSIKIAPKCIIGAGALILRDTKEKEVYIEKSTNKYPLNSDKLMTMMDISK